MANNTFTITISAVDNATAVVRKINDAISKTLRPVNELARSTKALGRELGLDKLGKSLKQVADAATKVGQQIGRIVAPLAAIIGVGSLTAVAELAKRWGELGTKIGYSAQAIGISAEWLQGLRGAAQLSGLSADALTAGMKTLGDTLEDALYGRNQGALVMLNQMGITIRRNADGAVDATAAFGDLATAISRVKNPQVQALIARTFGLEAVLPLLRQGKVGVAELVEQMNRSGAVMSGPALAAARSYNESVARMDISLQGLKNTIGARLIPILQPFVEQISAWVSKNRELVASNVAHVVDGMAQALR
jgi:hypothetical protein